MCNVISRILGKVCINHTLRTRFLVTASTRYDAITFMAICYNRCYVTTKSKLYQCNYLSCKYHPSCYSIQHNTQDELVTVYGYNSGVC